MSSSKNLPGSMRSHHCGELRESDIGKTVTLCGWLNKYRNLGSLHFIDVRDKYGVTQLGFEQYKGDVNELRKFSLESVIMATGKVAARPDSAKNPNMETGIVELQVEEIKLLSYAEEVPFLPHGMVQATEDLRLRYRYLDLRSKKLQDIMTLRSQTTRKAREALYDLGFNEIETPILYKTTPEGARDYIVPSRVHPGKVYALPQSPQTLKQLLMIANMDKYFQICRCFRDEDLRADRQPEFTQVDIEVSFPTLEYMKNLATHVVKKVFDMPDNFQMTSISYDEVLRDYGSDKPDVRFGLKQIVATDLFKNSSFATFSEVANAKYGMVKAMFIPASMGTLARKDIDALVEIVKPYGGKGVAWFKVENSALSGGVSKFIDAGIMSALSERSVEKGDGLWFFTADKNENIAHDCADALRRHFGKTFKLIKPDMYAFLWVYDFPLFDYDQDANTLGAKHHPFTRPKDEDMELYYSNDKSKVKDVKAYAYDIVCNGYEIGGGSMRIFDNKQQSRMFELLGFTPEDAQHQFGFFIEALKYGTPPHAGMAFGMDRMIMLLAKTDSIRDVIAFPKTASASDLMASSPSRPNPAQTKELGFKWLEE
ncbi:MAG TPA: aspartate--tRNA ligase [Bacteriovoracaceae bacterium]|nr:aspartate--tRNA ligase [Bacteriovoracaceae bacterium]